MRQKTMMCFFIFLNYYSSNAFYKSFTSIFHKKKNDYYHLLKFNNNENNNDLNPNDFEKNDEEIDSTSKIKRFNKNLRLGRSKDQDGKSNIWSVEPKMEVVDQEITDLNKNILISGLIVTGFLVSLPFLYTLNQFVQNIDY